MYPSFLPVHHTEASGLSWSAERLREHVCSLPLGLSTGILCSCSMGAQLGAHRPPSGFAAAVSGVRDSNFSGRQRTR